MSQNLLVVDDPMYPSGVSRALLMTLAMCGDNHVFLKQADMVEVVECRNPAYDKAKIEKANKKRLRKALKRLSDLGR